jgi:ubiquinone/menaquinone biosynthesis C-methylase UbiE
MDHKQMIWESHHHRFGLAGEDQADAIQKVLLTHRGRVLNVGCGLDGQKIASLASHCHVQVALDHEPGMLTTARRTCDAKKVIFIAADAHSLPFRSDSVDYVIALGLFAYVKDPVNVFREFRRVCRPDGYVMVTNSVSRPKEKHRAAGAEAGLTLVDEAEGYCPAASGDIKRRYLLGNMAVRPTQFLR